MGIYAFANPDKPAWIGHSEKDEFSLYATEEAAKGAKALDIVDIHSKYVTWFTYGFLLILAPIAAFLIIVSSMIVS